MPTISILAAAANGDLPSVRAALTSSIMSLFDYDDAGFTALHLASIKGHLQIVRCLLEAGADAEQVDKVHGATPLHWATVQGNTEIVALLLQAGADPDASDGTGKTSLLYALDGYAGTLSPWYGPIAPPETYRNISLCLLQTASAG